MSKGLLNSFKNGTIPETVKNTEENINEEVVATPVEPAKEESELDKLKRELAEARKKAEEAEGERDRAIATRERISAFGKNYISHTRAGRSKQSQNL